MAPKPKLTPEQIAEIQRQAASLSPPTQQQLADRYGVKRDLIRAAIKAAPAPAEAAPAGVSASSTMLPYDALGPNPRNPRKIFDAETITELAHSIEENGLLQPIVVRPAADEGKFEIIAGERRWRAIAELIGDDRWEGEIPCIIRQVNDAESLALSIVENLQREDISVIEEAKAFVALHEIAPETWSFQNIADAIGKTVRFVQQRAAIATKLHPFFQTALQEGFLNVEAARILCQVSQEDQLTIADDWNLIEDGELQLADAEPIAPEDAKYAVEALERARRLERERQQHREHNAKLDQAEQADPPSRDGIEIAPGDFFSAPSPAEPPKPEVKTEPVTKAHRYHAHNRKTLALREAIRAKPMLAIRTTCYALLVTTNDTVCISGLFNGIPEDRVLVSAAHDAAIVGMLGKLKFETFLDAKEKLKIWTFLEKAPDAEILELFANLMARHVGTRAGYDAQYGDDPVTIAIATAAGITGHEEDFGLTIQADDLAGVRKQALLGIADDAGTPAVNDEMKPGDIAAQIIAHSKDYVLPTLRFATSAEIEKAMTFK